MAGTEKFSGDAVRERREAAKLSRTAMAFFCGVTFMEVGRWERGGVTPHERNRIRIAEVLGCNPEDLMDPVEVSA